MYECSSFGFSVKPLIWVPMYWSFAKPEKPFVMPFLRTRTLHSIYFYLYHCLLTCLPIYIVSYSIWVPVHWRFRRLAASFVIPFIHTLHSILSWILSLPPNVYTYMRCIVFSSTNKMNASIVNKSINDHCDVLAVLEYLVVGQAKIIDHFGSNEPAQTKWFQAARTLSVATLFRRSTLLSVGIRRIIPQLLIFGTKTHIFFGGIFFHSGRSGERRVLTIIRSINHWNTFFTFRVVNATKTRFR